MCVHNLTLSEYLQKIFIFGGYSIIMDGNKRNDKLFGGAISVTEKIMLIDGNSLINRAFFALPNLSSPQGVPTGGVYGFLNIFFKMYDEERPDYVLVAFDLPQPTIRHEKYNEYKAHRKEMPDLLRPQLPLLKELLKKMGIDIYEQPGLEADDILGSLAVKAESLGMDAVVISGDRDLLQIASGKIKIRIPKTKANTTIVEDYYAEDVYEKYGVTPTEYIDVKALMGDSSDNIPGVPSIGEKTALKIITEYKNIENAIANASQIKPNKASENIMLYKDLAYLSRELATIITDVDVEMPGEHNAAGMFGAAALESFRELGFKSFIARAAKTQDNTALNVQNMPSEIENFEKIKSAELKGILIGAYMESAPVAAALIAIDNSHEGLAFFVNENGYFLEFEPGDDLTAFFDSLESDLICFDSKALQSYIMKNGFKHANIIFDTTLAAYVLDSTKSPYSYDKIAETYLNVSYPTEEDVFGKGKSKLAFRDADENEALKFACRHALVAYKTYEVMKDKIAKNGQDELYYKIELPTAKVLASIENYGIKVDKAAIIAYEAELSERIDKLESEIYELTGEVFNINSPKQLGEILFTKLELKGGKKTKTGYSTAHDVLEKLKSKHPAISKVLEYRTLTKLRSTYCDGLLNALCEETSKIYSTFNQTVTATGRLSSTEPNLQNIPIRTDLGRQLRKVFIPSEGFTFVDADYSQIELRVLAHMAGDENMIEAFRSGADIHSSTAAQVRGIDISEVAPHMRNEAKAVNFGIVYGIGAFSLSEDLGISVKDAENYINAYLAKYRGVKKFMDDSVKSAKEKGYSETIFARRREIIELKNPNFNIRSFGERAAMNMPIQGSAADIMKLAMVQVYEKLTENKLKSRIILQVHDELLLEAALDEVDIVTELLREAMENAAELAVPLVVDVSVGDTWYDTK